MQGIEMLGASPTRVAILQFFMTHTGYYSRAEVAAICDLENTGIRRHFEALEAVGAITPTHVRGTRRGMTVKWKGNPGGVQKGLTELLHSVIQ